MEFQPGSSGSLLIITITKQLDIWRTFSESVTGAEILPPTLNELSNTSYRNKNDWISVAAQEIDRDY